jgi:hypothetical protein
MPRRLYDDAIFPIGNVTQKELNDLHVYPRQDLSIHILHHSCPCKPELVEMDGVEFYCHNAFDGREKYETKERKPH